MSVVRLVRPSVWRAVVLVWALLAALRPATARADAQPALRDERIFNIHIRISEQQWQLMQPTRASRLATVLGVGQHPTTQQALAPAPDEAAAAAAGRKSKVEGQRLPPTLFGYEFAWVRAAVEVDGKSYADVAVRLKGNGSYSQTNTLMCRPLKLDFDRFVPGQRLEGLQAISLRNNALDPSELRETLSFWLFRQMGVPAPRTSLALVYLTIAGRCDREFLGVYTMVEEIDNDFLKRQFGTSKGLLIKPETTRNMPYLGPRWDAYQRLGIKSEGTPLAQQRLIDLLRLVHCADDQALADGIGSYLDLDQFLRFVAVNAVMVNTDSFLFNGHNFYVHLHPRTGRATFIPWDLNYSFGSSGTSMAQWTALSIRRPYGPHNLMLTRLLANERISQQYLRIVREMLGGCFSPEQLHGKIERMEAAVRDAMAQSRSAGRPTPTTTPSTGLWVRPDLKEFVTARKAAVLAQLAETPATQPAAPAARPPTAVPQPALPATQPTTIPKLVVMPATQPAAAPPPATNPAPSAPAPTNRDLRAARRAAAQASVATRPVIASERPAATRPAAPSLRPVAAPRPVPRRPLPPHPLAGAILRELDGERNGLFSRDEAQESAKLFWIALVRWHRGVGDEAAIADTLDRLGLLLDPFPPSVAQPPTTAPAAPLPTAGTVWARAIFVEANVKPGERLALPQLQATVDRLFSEADGNGDGALTLKELSDLLDRMVPRRP